MRKMKKLLRIRNTFMTLFHWGQIHFALNTLYLIAFMIALCFTGITPTMSILFVTCMGQYIPVFIVMTGKYILETILYKKTIAIIKTKLYESKVKFDDVNIVIEDFTLHSCILRITNEINTPQHFKEVLSIVHGMNRKFSNRYTVTITLEEEVNNYA